MAVTHDGQCPILMYHALAPERSPISIHPAIFRKQMQWLHENDFTIISLGKAVSALRDRAALPRRAVVITFDDGFDSIYEHAYPVLSNYGFPATIFLVSAYCGRANDWPSQPPGIPRYPLASWQRIREMSRNGIDFGAHTISHAPLDQLDTETKRQEILGCKEEIEGQLGRTIAHFAYPYGRHDPATAAIVGQTYASACGTELGIASSASDPYALERLEMLYFTSQPALHCLLSPGLLRTYTSARGFLRSIAAGIRNHSSSRAH